MHFFRMLSCFVVVGVTFALPYGYPDGGELHQSPALWSRSSNIGGSKTVVTTAPTQELSTSSSTGPVHPVVLNTVLRFSKRARRNPRPKPDPETLAKQRKASTALSELFPKLYWVNEDLASPAHKDIPTRLQAYSDTITQSQNALRGQTNPDVRATHQAEIDTARSESNALLAQHFPLWHQRQSLITQIHEHMPNDYPDSRGAIMHRKWIKRYTEDPRIGDISKITGEVGDTVRKMIKDAA